MNRDKTWTILLSTFALAGLGCQVSLTDIGAEVGESSTSDEGLSESEGDAGTDTEGAALIPAAGIEIIEIEANQGIEIALTSGTDWLGPADRDARLVGGRDTLLRVHWQVAEGWQPHPVSFRLTLGPDDEVAEQTVEVSADSARGSLDTTVNFVLRASEGHAAPGTAFEIELLESALDHDAQLGEFGNHAPAGGPALVGFESAPMEFEVVFVPIHYTGDGLDTLPMLDVDSFEPVVDRLYELYPVTTIVWSIHAPLEISEDISDLGQVLAALQTLRASDDPAPHIYYHALLDPGCGSPPCTVGNTSGLSMMPSATKDDASARIGVSVFGSIDHTIETVSHELGHSQGLVHGYCPSAGAGGGQDPNYPHPDGLIGAWGYGLVSGTLHDPATTRSFMSYCTDTWVSQREWNLLYTRIETLSSWNFE